MPEIIILLGYVSSLVLVYYSLKAQSLIEKKYNDLRVENARLKSKVGK